jgi:hypothetical protein
LLIVLTSCTDIVKNNEREKSKNYKPILLKSIEMIGDFGGVFDCEQAVIKFEDYMGKNKPYFMVELRRTDKRLPVDITKGFKRCGYGVGNQDICFQLSINDNLNIPFASSNNTYSSNEILHALKLKSNESSWLKFTFYEDDIIRITKKHSDLNTFSAKITTSFMLNEEKNEALSTQSKNSISNDLDEIGDIFETYVDLIEKISDENIEDIINSNNNTIESITTENISEFLELYVQLIDAQMDMYKDINKGDLTAIQAYRKVLEESINFAKKINEFDESIDPDDFDKIEVIKDKYFKILSILSE